MDTDPLPQHYREALRTLVRFAAIMTIPGLLTGVLFQESAKALHAAGVDPGLHVQATLGLSLVHGHVLTMAVLIPLAVAGGLLMARRAGGRELGKRPLAYLTRGYLPLLCLSLVLMLAKGYHVLLAVEHGATDLAEVDERFFFGQTALRHIVYGLTHAGMSICLGVFVLALWHSLARKNLSG